MVVLGPCAGAKLPAGEATVGGVAFNDGEAKIDTVLVSTDQGATWRPAELRVPKSSLCLVSLECPRATRFRHHANLGAGHRRAGRSQPLDGGVHWNQHGYTWNGVEKIDVTVG